MDKLNKFKVHELIELCETKNIKVSKGLKKKEIINLYLEHTKSSLTLELNNSDENDSDENDSIVKEILDDTVESVVADEPSVVVDEPVAVVDEPGVVVDEPGVVVDEPVTVVDEPVAVVDEPGVVVDEPGVVVDEPAHVIIKNFEILNEKLLFLTTRIEELEFKLANNITSVIIESVDKDGLDKDGVDKDGQDVIIDKDVEMVEMVDDNSVLGEYSVKFKDENINLLNQLYTMGIRFNKILDVNCYDKELIDYIEDRGYHIKGYIFDKFYFDNEYSEKIDISLSTIVDKEYDLVLCTNLLDLLSEDEIKEYYKNILRVSSNLIVIKVNESNRQIDKYTELFNEIVNEQTECKIDRYVTNNLPVNVFILRKTIFSENN
jgi:hypothetical protein